jgi:hypothetical protein
MAKTDADTARTRESSDATGAAKTTPLAATTPYLSKSKIRFDFDCFRFRCRLRPRQGRRNNIVRSLAVNHCFWIFSDPETRSIRRLPLSDRVARDGKSKRRISPANGRPSAGKHRHRGNRRQFEKSEEKGLSGTFDGPQFKHLGGF